MRAEYICLTQHPSVPCDVDTDLFSSAADQRRPLLLNFVLLDKLLVERKCDSGLFGTLNTPLRLQLGALYIKSTCKAGCICKATGSHGSKGACCRHLAAPMSREWWADEQ